MRLGIFKRGLDQFQRRGLFFVHRQLGIGNELFRAVRIARYRLFAQFDEAAPDESAKGGIVERSLAEEIRGRNRRGQLRDRVQQFRLARRALAQLLDLLRRGDSRGMNEKLFLPADLGTSYDLGKQASHHCLDGAAVVTRHPARQLDQARTHGWSISEEGLDRPHAFGGGFVERVDDRGERRFIAKRHADARAHDDPTGQLFRHAVIELAADRAINDDSGEGGHAKLNCSGRCCVN